MDKKDKRIRELEILLERALADVDKKGKRIQELERNLEELERRLSLNSSNSGKPPSSDGLKKPPVKTSSLRTSNKPKGGQVGHEGATLEQVADPDEVIVHQPMQCLCCSADLENTPILDVEKRQIFDVIIRKHVVEHQSITKVCGKCGTKSAGQFPTDIKGPVQYGPELRAAVLYLSEQFVSKDRVCQAASDIFGIPISDTTLFSYETLCAQNLKPFYEEAFNVLKKAPVKHQDETGMRVGGRTEWVHVLSSTGYTYLWYGPKRGALLEGIEGITVHDFLKTYFKMPNVTHAFCNAHLLRELKAIIENEKEPWADDMASLLRDICRIVSKKEEKIPPNRIQRLLHVYNTILEKGFSYHKELTPLVGKRGRIKRRDSHNLLIRFRDNIDGILLSLKNPIVPFTNNQAERDLRMVKTKQKVSGCFRTETGVRNFLIMRSFIGTLRKQNLNILENLKYAISGTLNLDTIFAA